MSARECSNDEECLYRTVLAFVPAGAGIGAAAGAIIDFAIRKYDPVYVKPAAAGQLRIRVAPVLSSQRRGVAVSFRF